MQMAVYRYTLTGELHDDDDIWNFRLTEAAGCRRRS
jgi:hypothetical protein